MKTSGDDVLGWIRTHTDASLTPEQERSVRRLYGEYETCDRTPPGWWCSRKAEHTGPCALRPRWWNVVSHPRFAPLFRRLS